MRTMARAGRLRRSAYLTIPAPWNIRCDYQLARLRADPPRWPCIALSSATLVRGISGRRVYAVQRRSVNPGASRGTRRRHGGSGVPAGRTLAGDAFRSARRRSHPPATDPPAAEAAYGWPPGAWLGSWVVNRTVRAGGGRGRRSAAPPAGSRSSAEHGSSSRIFWLALTSARAINTSCCWPPEGAEVIFGGRQSPAAPAPAQPAGHPPRPAGQEIT